MCNAAGTRSRGAEAFTFVAVVILMVGAMTFEEVCPGEGFGANIADEALPESMGCYMSLEMLGPRIPTQAMSALVKRCRELWLWRLLLLLLL